MKISKPLIAIIYTCITLNIKAQISKDDISYLVNNEQFFTLNSIYNNPEAIWSEQAKLEAESTLSYLFNKPQKSINTIQTLLKNYRNNLPNNGEAYFHMLGNLYAETYQYADAARIYNLIGDNNSSIFEKLSSEKPLETIFSKKNFQIKFEIDSLGMLNVPIEIHKKNYPFIFDTGNTACLVVEDMAKELKIRTIIDSITINDSTSGKYGILDSMKLGDVTFKNIPFYIIPNINMKLCALSLPIIKTLNNVDINKVEQKIFIHDNPTIKGEKNLIIAQNHMFLRAKIGSEYLLLRFDTGDSGASMFKNYYKNHSSKIREQALKTTNTLVHIGGTEQVNGFNLNNFPITIGSKKVTFPSLFVATQSIPSLENLPILCYGTIGMALLQNVNIIKINFNLMRAEVE